MCRSILIRCCIWISVLLACSIADVQANNLINNGDFSSEIGGFTSQYQYVVGTDTAIAEGTYSIVTTAKQVHPAWGAYFDHTSSNSSGRYFVANPLAETNSTVWQSSVVSVTQTNTVYRFEIWIMKAYPLDENPPLLLFQIGDGKNWTEMGQTSTLESTKPGTWLLTYVDARFATTGTYNLRLKNANGNGALAGNDLGIDDVYFGLRSSAPSVASEPGIGDPNFLFPVAVPEPLPPKQLALALDSAPRLTVQVSARREVKVEWADTITGPWVKWSNVVSSSERFALLDSSARLPYRFYRAEAKPGPPGYVWIAPGNFMMGSPASEPNRGGDELQHEVVLSSGFWLSDHEVTQAEYEEVMGANPSYFKGSDRPVETVSWNDAMLYCQKLTERERAAGRITAGQAYRLPTEAEWEYAARAGTTGPRYGEYNAIAWYGANSGSQTRVVKEKVPNAWGLYDMIGNVWEWCSDWYGGYPSESSINPTGPTVGSKRVRRGDAYYSQEKFSRAAQRLSTEPESRSRDVGFRPALGVAPEVVEDQTEVVGLEVESFPRLTLQGPPGTVARVERAEGGGESWTAWSNVVIGAEGVIMVDSSSKDALRSYRVQAEPIPTGPAGFVWIAPGSFMMGSPSNELGQNPGELQHTVTLSQGFWMSDHETTQAEYESIMGTNPSRFKGSDRPVEMVSWKNAALYCEKLTERDRLAGRITGQQAYRLPTEAEWEYAARAWTSGARHGELDSIAWWQFNSGAQTRPVKQKEPNAAGLFDMMGNVSEWCSDWYDYYPTGSVTDPTGPSMGVKRVIRGGNWGQPDKVCRSAYRAFYDPVASNSNLGFRPVLSSVR